MPRAARWRRSRQRRRPAPRMRRRSSPARSTRSTAWPRSTSGSPTPIEALRGAEAQLPRRRAHALRATSTAPSSIRERLRAVDERMSAWVGLARRYRRPPAELAALLAQWQDELRALDAAADLEGLRGRERRRARRLRAARPGASPPPAAPPRPSSPRGDAGDAAARHGGRPVRGRARGRPTRRSRSASNRPSSWSPATPARRRGRSARSPPAASCRASPSSMAVVTSELDTGGEAPLDR